MVERNLTGTFNEIFGDSDSDDGDYKGFVFRDVQDENSLANN